MEKPSKQLSEAELIASHVCQIEAESAKIINEEKWKDRIVGFVFGFISAILSGVVINLVTRCI